MIVEKIKELVKEIIYNLADKYNDKLRDKNRIIRCTICGDIYAPFLREFSTGGELYCKIKNPYIKKKVYICPGCTGGMLQSSDYNLYINGRKMTNDINYKELNDYLIKNDHKKITILGG